jgi:hypothetical protein
MARHSRGIASAPSGGRSRPRVFEECRQLGRSPHPRIRAPGMCRLSPLWGCNI